MLRDYQLKSIELIRKEFGSGNRKVLLHLATGAGKTVIFSEILKKASLLGKQILVVVRGRKLVDQASQRLLREKVEHGVMMAGHWNYRPHLSTQVASIDTLISRKLKPNADLIIIDEAHMAISKGYKEFLFQYENPFILAVTATPYVSANLRHIASKIIHPITTEQLIEQGHLSPFRYFAPSLPDLSKVSISKSTKDYVNDELEGAMVAGGLTGRVVDHWVKLAENRATLCFAVNIHHSKILVENFKAKGIACEHCDADTPDAERAQIIRRLEDGETKVVCNVGIFCTGIDIPSLGAIIMARPTRSKNLFIQQAGRGTRIFPGKEDCILLDHSGNILRHGFPTDEWEVNLDGKSIETHVKKSVLCKNCFAVYRGMVCPACKTEIPAAPKIEIVESDEELKEIDPLMREFIRLKMEAKQKGYKIAWVYQAMKRRFGDRANKYIPTWFFSDGTCQFESNPIRKLYGTKN